MYIYIYICTHNGMSLSLSLCNNIMYIYIYIYMYIYIYIYAHKQYACHFRCVLACAPSLVYREGLLEHLKSCSLLFWSYMFMCFCLV